MASGDGIALTNTELVHRMQAAPASTWPLFHRRYESLVRGVVHRMMGPDADQHDLVQQIFCELLASGFQLREPERLPGWVRAFTVCSVCRELRRRSSRRKREESVPAPASRDLVHDVEARDLLIRAAAMIARLPRLERDTFTMRVVEGRTCDEVASLTGYSTATIKRRMARANRRMLSMLARNAELMALARAPSDQRLTELKLGA
jgi:RNA polymerase sigma-70 factor (ECF subfamily)